MSNAPTPRDNPTPNDPTVPRPEGLSPAAVRGAAADALLKFARGELSLAEMNAVVRTLRKCTAQLKKQLRDMKRGVQ